MTDPIPADSAWQAAPTSPDPIPPSDFAVLLAEVVFVEKTRCHVLSVKDDEGHPHLLLETLDSVPGQSGPIMTELARRFNVMADASSIACAHADKMDAWPKKKTPDMGEDHD